MPKFKIKTENLLEKLLPVLLVLVIALSFGVGVLWQKVANLEKGITTTDLSSAGANPSADPSGKLSADQAKNIPPISDRDHVRGNKNADVMLVEYADFECPYCKDFHPTLLQALSDYGDKIGLVYRHFPLSFHQNAQKEAEASECVWEQGGDTAFWKFGDDVFDRTTSNGTGFALDKLAPLAKEIGLDATKFQSCLDSGKYTDYVTNQESEGTTAGITGTPGTFVINKKGEVWLVPGAVPYDSLKQTIDLALKS
jgi:protein-disulfide isomerase